MKKKQMKRGLILTMALGLSLGLCACGSKGKSMENAALAKEHVYRLQKIEMPSLKQDDNSWTNILDTQHVNGKIYVLTRTNSYDQVTYEEQNVYALNSMNEDGSDVKSVEIQMPEKEEAEEIEETEGEATEEVAGEGAEETAEDSENGVNIPVDVPVENTWEYTNYDNFVLTAEGELYGIKLQQKETYLEDSYTSEGKYYICHWDKDGNFLWEKELEGVESNESEYFYIHFVTVNQDGSLNILVGGNENLKVSVDAEGNTSDVKSLSDKLNAVMSSSERTLQKEDGTLLVIYHDENDWQKTFCVDYNMDTDTLGEAKSIPSNVLNGWDYNHMGIRKNGDLYYTTNSGIFTYTFGEAEPEMMMDYTNSDIVNASFNSIIELSDTSFAAIFSEQNTMQAGIFNYVNPEEIADKAVVVLAGNYLDYNVKKRVVEFNRTNEEYRIVTKEYNVYNTYEDYEAGVSKLNNDIIAGNMPDILLNYEYDPLPIENYISKGWIADVNKLIEKDEELSQVEFLQNVFDAYSVDGKLYYVVPDFEVSTMIAKAALVGDRTNWSMADMQQVLAGMGDGTKAFGDTTRESFMYMALRYCANQFVDVKTGKCSFNTEDFISMMEFAKTLPEEITYDEDYWMNYDWEQEQSQYRENRTLMMGVSTYNFQDLIMTLNGYFGEPVSFVGFPTEAGNGAYIQGNTTFALSARSENLDGAWQFVRYYLTDAYQRDEAVYYPVNKAIFFEKSKQAMERPYWENEEGEKEYFDYTMYINGEEVKIDPLTQDQLNQVTDYIQSISNRYYYNEDVVNIVTEEIGAFYSGQKSAQDVADVIQRRVQIYVDENS